MSGHQRALQQLIKTALVTITLTCSAFAASRYDATLKQGMSVLEKGKPDSAIACFIQSYADGLPKDSLFYFWAEALLQKGVLDSALAANFIAANSTVAALRIKARYQRYTIYRLLEWNSDAKNLLDTIRASKEYRRISLLPEVEIGISAGYGAQRRGSDTAAPWGMGEGSSFYNDEQGVFGKADIKSSWVLLKGVRSLSAGLSGAATYRQYTPGGLRYATDSTDITGSVFATVSGNALSSTGALSLNRRIDDSLFVRGSVEGGMVGNNRLLPMLWGGGALSVTTDGMFSSVNAWLFSSLQQPLGKLLQLHYQLFANTYVEHAAAFGFSSGADILYVDDTQLQYPVFYTDSTYTQVIDTSAASVKNNIFGMIALTDAIRESGRDSVISLALYQPYSNLMVNPRLSLQFAGAVPVQISFAWRWNYYWEKFEWDQLVNYAQYLLYSRSEEKYLYIPEGLLINGLQATHGDNGGLSITPAAQAGSSVIHHSMRRIDNTLSADMSLEVYDGRFGTGTLRATGAKTWSTLLNKSPVEIPEWSFSTSLQWRFKFFDR